MNLYIFDSHEKTAYQYYVCIVAAENVNEAMKIIEDECTKNRLLQTKARYNKTNPYKYEPTDLLPKKADDPTLVELKDYQDAPHGTIILKLIFDLPDDYQKGFIYYNGHDG